MPSPRFAGFAAALRERYRRLGTLWVLLPALAAMAAFVLLFQVTGRMVADEGIDVLHLQKSFTPERFGAVVAAWGDGIEAFKWSLIMLDFAFPLLYAAALAGLIAVAGGPAPRRAALVLFCLPWAAAGFDWVENLLHLWLLADVHHAADAAAAAYPALPVAAASTAAMVKFALLFAASAGAVILALRRRSWWAAATGAALFASFTPVLWA
ncbi:MAG: hypothetical protein JW785_10285 [Acidimicrobiia bacterium]|nr:hypothetical protein [Acidimicrobiia bacterium]